MGDDLASDDEYLFDAGLIDSSDNRGTAILSSDDDDEDITALKESAISSVPSKKRKNNNNNAEGDDITSKKRNKKKKKEKVVPTNSKNVLIHAGRGIALDSVESQSMFLNTLYSHATKLSEGNTTKDTNANKEDTEDNDELDKEGDSAFSFQEHLYQAPKSVDTKTTTYNHSNIAAYLKSGALPSNKRLKNWKHSHSPMVLVITISARRAVELMKQLSSEIKLPICKLFAKHLKVEEQAELLCNGVGGSKNNNNQSSNGGGNNKKKAKYYSLAVGTPNRLLKLLQHTEGEGGGGPLRLNHTELIIIDCHTDSKGWNVCTLKDTSSDLMEVLRMGVIPQLEKRTGKVKLGLY